MILVAPALVGPGKPLFDRYNVAKAPRQWIADKVSARSHVNFGHRFRLVVAQERAPSDLSREKRLRGLVDPRPNPGLQPVRADEQVVSWQRSTSRRRIDLDAGLEHGPRRFGPVL